jgi:hypothetical protein
MAVELAAVSSSTDVALTCPYGPEQQGLAMRLREDPLAAVAPGVSEHEAAVKFAEPGTRMTGSRESVPSAPRIASIRLQKLFQIGRPEAEKLLVSLTRRRK